MTRPTTSTIEEPSRRLPVPESCDVLVVGGGIAGAAAAVAAARSGAAVTLLEKTCALGGLATLGNVTVWLPLCDGRGRQVSGGMAEELLKLSVADLKGENRTARFIGVPACWQPGGDQAARRQTRYLVHFNPSAYLLALEQLVVENGVRLLYDTRVCAVRREASRITHAIVENKSGRSAIACRVVVDASGDADVCALAGEATESLDTNVLCGWFYHLDQAGLHLNVLSNAFSHLADRQDAVGPFFRGDEAGDVTAHLLGSRQLLRQKLAELREKTPEADLQAINPPTLPCFRMTRRLVGAHSLSESHKHQWLEDTVGLTGDWRRAGPVYPISLRALCGVQNENLLAAGRCISADATLWDVTRALPGCALTGQAAGTAAALAARQSIPAVMKLPIQALQAQLRAQGARLDPALVKPAEA